MNTKMMVTQNKGQQEIFIGSRKTSGQNNVWEDLNFLLPRSFIEELARYRKDNAVTTTYSVQGPQLHCCEKCLKAHALKTAIRMGFDRTSMTHIEKMFPGETGHVGYYTDREKLIEL